MTELTILIPAHNEAAGLAQVLRRLAAVSLPKSEVIVIDDGSKDETAAVAAAEGARVVRHDQCRGYGAALKTGLAASRGYGMD